MTTLRLVAIVAVALCLASSVHAAFLFDWTTSPQPHLVTVPDPTGDAVGGWAGRDVTQVMWGQDGIEAFRLDLDVLPDTGTNGKADLYGVYVDAQPGVSGTMGSFIPSSLSGAGIDFVALVSFNNNFVSPALYQWDGSSWVDISSLAGLTFTRQAVGSDYGLEWAFNQGILPSVLDPSWHSISFWGSSVIGGSAQDITDQGITPEPTTLALLGLGLGGLYLRRRRNGS